MDIPGAVIDGAHPPVLAHVEVAALGIGSVEIDTVTSGMAVGDRCVAARADASIDNLRRAPVVDQHLCELVENDGEIRSRREIGLLHGAQRSVRPGIFTPGFQEGKTRYDGDDFGLLARTM